MSRLFYNLRILKVPDTVQLRTAIIMLFYYYIIIRHIIIYCQRMYKFFRR